MGTGGMTHSGCRSDSSSSHAEPLKRWVKEFHFSSYTMKKAPGLAKTQSPLRRVTTLG
jgi:hypothetical protein